MCGLAERVVSGLARALSDMRYAIFVAAVDRLGPFGCSSAFPCSLTNMLEPSRAKIALDVLGL